MSETIPAVFDQTVGANGNKVALTFKRDGTWHPITYREFQQRAEKIASALIQLGLESGDRVGLLSENRPEWVIADQGVLAAAAITVPIYPTLTAQQTKFLLSDSGARVLVVSNQAQLAKIAQIKDEVPQLTHVVAMDEGPIPELGKATMAWEAFLQYGDRGMSETADARRARKQNLQPSDVASIIYTSGTTGDPKGVMLTHRNLYSNFKIIPELVSIGAGDSCLSFLPLSHVFERLVYYCFVSCGATINYAESIEKVSDNLIEVRPTFMCSVPRLFEKIRARVYDAANQAGGFKKAAFEWALATARRARIEREKTGSISPILALKVAVADRLVFVKIRERTGGRLRYAISGGAPLSYEVGEFFDLIGITVLEGYGMTETSPVVSVNCPAARKLGTVGKPIPGVEVRIADDGELLVKGPNVMKGYWNDPEATNQTIDPDQWLHTGDIGQFDAEGFLRITDRKKEILVLSNGKNVAPAPLENAIMTSGYISQAFVVGDNRNFVSALIVPNFEAAEHWARNEGVGFAARWELAAHDRLKQLLRAEIDRVTRDFARYEQIKEFVVLPEEFSLEKGELTPKLSYKRRAISDLYSERIARVYADAGTKVGV